MTRHKSSWKKGESQWFHCYNKSEWARRDSRGLNFRKQAGREHEHGRQVKTGQNQTRQISKSSPESRIKKSKAQEKHRMSGRHRNQTLQNTCVSTVHHRKWTDNLARVCKGWLWNWLHVTFTDARREVHRPRRHKQKTDSWQTETLGEENIRNTRNRIGGMARS